MNKGNLIVICSACFLLSAVAVFAADQDQTQQQFKTQDMDLDRDRIRDRDQIYGSQLMTQQERAEYRANMRNKKTQQERKAYRLEHHKKMQERARERGLKLPDTQPAMGEGRGKGGRMNTGGGRRQGR
jgi:hypothetical protein